MPRVVKSGKSKSSPTMSRVLAESNQRHSTRIHLLEKIEEELDRNIITFFTSTRFAVIIDDRDADMIEGLLELYDNSKGITLILNSLGGSALAAERIINICRTHSNNNFEVIVPRKAKSAATMICMGARKILMGRTAELGPIDPQVLIRTESGDKELRAVYYIIDSYEKLFKEAVRTTGNVQPYLQQLERFDAKDIREYKEINKLAEDIAVKVLRSGMMKRKTVNFIKNKIKPFTKPTHTRTHGRPIYIDDARRAGIKIDEITLNSKLWKLIWKLYVRTNNFVNSSASKVVESVVDSWEISAPER